MKRKQLPFSYHLDLRKELGEGRVEGAFPGSASVELDTDGDAIYPIAETGWTKASRDTKTFRFCLAEF